MIDRTDHTDHDDFGGLQRDLLATASAIDRRGLLRLAARFGAGIGALSLLGQESPTRTTSAACRKRTPTAG